jgi:chemotaxis protein CheC
MESTNNADSQNTNSPKNMELSHMDLDALREVANIGTGQASMALSVLFDQRVDIGLPRTSVVKLADVGKDLNSSETMIGIYSSIKEGLLGNILLVVPLTSALNLTNKLHGKSSTCLEDEDIKVLSKIGSILNSCYLTGVAQLLEQRILFHPPNVISIFGNSIGDFLSASLSEDSKVLLVDIDFAVEEFQVSGGFILILTLESIYPLITKLQQKMLGTS